MNGIVTKCDWQPSSTGQTKLSCTHTEHQWQWQIESIIYMVMFGDRPPSLFPSINQASPQTCIALLTLTLPLTLGVGIPLIQADNLEKNKDANFINFNLALILEMNYTNGACNLAK